jgi:hypothetical protein
MPRAKSCSPPKTVQVKGHWRQVRKTRKKSAAATSAARAAKLPWIVVNTRTGAVVSRHRYFTAAIREEKRLDRISFRQGKGRPYDARKAA